MVESASKMSSNKSDYCPQTTRLTTSIKEYKIIPFTNRVGGR